MTAVTLADLSEIHWHEYFDVNMSLFPWNALPLLYIRPFFVSWQYFGVYMLLFQKGKLSLCGVGLDDRSEVFAD